MKCEYILKKQLSCLDGLDWDNELPVMKIQGNEFLKADSDNDKFQELSRIIQGFYSLSGISTILNEEKYDYYKTWVKKSNSIVFAAKYGERDECGWKPVWIEVAIMNGTNYIKVIEYSKDNGKHIWRVK